MNARSIACAGAVALGLLAASPARAQFSNHSIGIEAGALILGSEIGASSGPVLGIDSTLYIESGFDLYFRIVAGIHKDNTTRQNAVGFFPALGARYLFSEDRLRPYLGLNFAFMHFFGADSLPGALFAINPFAGIEYYFQENTCIGLQPEYHRVLVLNGPNSGNAFGIIAKIAWGF